MTRLAVAAPARLRCGISDYARFLSRALGERFEILQCDFPDSSRRAAWKAAAASADHADVVHVHYEYSLFHTVKPYRNRFATFMRRLHPPTIVTLHDLLPELHPKLGSRQQISLREILRDLVYAPWFSRWEPRLYRLADHWLVHTEEHRATVADVTGPDSVGCFFHPIPAATHQWSPPAIGVNLVSLGFVKAHKGYLRVLDTLKQFPAVTWTIAGGAQTDQDKTFLHELLRVASQSGVANRVTVTGYLEREELEELSTAATLAIFPFDKATGSGSLTWAIALGMPIIATDLLPLRDLVAAGAGIELLDPERPESWAACISDLATSPERLESLSSSNRRYSKQNSYRDLARRLTPLFENLARGLHGSRSDS